MAPTRSAPKKPTRGRGQPPGSRASVHTPRPSNDKISKRRGRPPGSRNSLPSSNRRPEPKAAKVAPSRKRKAGTQEGGEGLGVKRIRAAETKDSGREKVAKGRGKSARTSNVVTEEEEDELSFTQPQVVPKATSRSGHRERQAQSSAAKKRGRPSQGQSPGEDADETSAIQGNAKKTYTQLVPRTKRIAQDVIETWPLVPPQVLDQILQTLKDAKRDIVNTQRDEQKAIAADETLGSITRMLMRQMSGSRIPPQAKDIHFNIDKLTERYGHLFRELTTERHSHQLLAEQVKVAQHLLNRDEESLEQLKKNARDWKMRWKKQEKDGRLHPLLKDLDNEMNDDGPDDINLKRIKAVDISMIDTPDSDLAPHLEQLRRSLEDMQGNHEQVAGVDVGIRNAQVALDHVLFKHASAEQYAAL